MVTRATVKIVPSRLAECTLPGQIEAMIRPLGVKITISSPYTLISLTSQRLPSMHLVRRTGLGYSRPSADSGPWPLSLEQDPCRFQGVQDPCQAQDHARSVPERALGWVIRTSARSGASGQKRGG